MPSSFLTQDVYSSAFHQDMDHGKTMQATANLLQTFKFVEPLANRRLTHDRIRKVRFFLGADMEGHKMCRLYIKTNAKMLYQMEENYHSIRRVCIECHIV